jgi:hypothetical protein
MARVYSNRLSEYTHDNGGRVLILFLLFLLSLYSLNNSGLSGMAMVSSIPVVILFIYMAFKYRMFTFWVLFAINYLAMFLLKEHKFPPVPVSLPNEMLEIALIAIAIIDLKESHFENLANLMLIGLFGWCAFCTLEVFNDTCDLGINVGAWFTGIRYYMLLLYLAYTLQQPKEFINYLLYGRYLHYFLLFGVGNRFI